MKIYSWNVNGIRAVEKKGVFKPFLQEHQPDVLCLQETKVQPDQIAEEFAVAYPEYEQYWYSAEKKGYSGTAIFTKQSPVSVSYGFPDEVKSAFHLRDEYGDTNNEGRVVVAEYETFYVCSVYTPNAKDDLSRLRMRQQWDPAFATYMQKLQAQKPIICGGDFNVAHTELDLARPKENRGKKGFTDEERSGFTELLAVGLVDSFRVFHHDGGQYTWWSHFANARERNVGWRIDYLLVSEALKPLLRRADIHAHVTGSDHCPVGVNLAL